MLKYIFKYVLYYLRKFWYLVALVFMAIIFTIFAKKQDLLNAYTGGSSTYTVEETNETETEVAMEGFSYDGLALTIKIPEGWGHVTKDGYDTFIHTPSASSIQLQVMSYYPQVNNVTADSLGEDLLAMGYSILNFSRTDLNSYFVTYQSETSAGVMDYIDFVIWDLSHVVKLHVTVQDENYDRLEDELLASLDSLVWDYENPIPEGVYINYSLNGDFQFGIPDGWTTGEQDGSLYAYDENGVSMSVAMLTDQDPDIESLTQLDYANFAATGKNNFILSQFEKNTHYIYAEATYSTNNVMMGMMQYYGIYGTTHYIITFDIPYDMVSNYYSLCYSCIGTFQVFGTQSDGEEGAGSEVSGSMGIQEDLGLNDLLGDVPISSNPQTDTQEQSEQETFASDDSTAQTETQTNATTAEQGESVEASSFADALVQSIGISSDRALEVAGIWASLSVGTPTYVQAIKESSITYVIYIQTDGDMTYYMTITKDGILQSIAVGTEDGQLLYQSAN